MGCFSSKTSTSGSSSSRKPRYESSMNPPNSSYSMPSMTESPLKSSASWHGPLSVGKPKFEPCSRFSRKTRLQSVAITSKLSGPTVATISNGVGVTKFCINQVIAAVCQSVRKMAIAEATKGIGLCGKSNKVVQADSGGLGTSVIVPWLRFNYPLKLYKGSVSVTCR